MLEQLTENTTQSQSNAIQKEEIAPHTSNKMTDLNVTPGLNESPRQFSDSFVSLNCLSEVSNIYDPFKDDLQEDILQIRKE